MTITNGYATLAEARLQLGYTNSADTTNDAAIEKAIEAASRAIDDYCHRKFYASGSETRYYTATTWVILFLPDDVLTISALATDDNQDRTYDTDWETTDYDTYPLNGSPITHIEVAPGGDYTFPKGLAKGVKITGTFGYCATATPPKPIQEACLLQAVRLFKRTKDAPFGIAGASDMGQAVAIAKFDPDVEMLLSPYRRLV